MPIFVAAVLYYATNETVFDPFSVYFLIVLLVVGLGKVLLSERRYLVDITFSDSNLIIKYTTPFLISKTLVLPISSITAIEFARRNWMVGYPPSVNIQHHNEWITFEFLDKKLLRRIRAEFISHELLSRSFAYRTTSQFRRF